MEAKNLLSQTDTPIGEVATRVGILDPSYFAGCSKKHVGVSPLRLPQQVRKILKPAKIILLSYGLKRISLRQNERVVARNSLNPLYAGRSDRRSRSTAHDRNRASSPSEKCRETPMPILIKAPANRTDTLSTYEIHEVVVNTSPETGRLASHLHDIGRHGRIRSERIEAVRDLSLITPNLYIPDYGSKMTSSIYIRGIGARIDRSAGHRTLCGQHPLPQQKQLRFRIL